MPWSAVPPPSPDLMDPAHVRLPSVCVLTSGMRCVWGPSLYVDSGLDQVKALDILHMPFTGAFVSVGQSVGSVCLLVRLYLSLSLCS